MSKWVALGVKSEPLKIIRTQGRVGYIGVFVGDCVQGHIVKTPPQGVCLFHIMRCSQAVQEAAKKPGSF